jgi:AcrR family transcriptional regulator
MMAASTGNAGPKRSVGRPRHYDEATERELVVDAAYRVLRDHRDRSLTIADILSAAGVSTRSFYRHFSSKDELLCAMYMRDAERAAVRLTERVAQRTSPREGLEKWIDEIFSFHVGPRAERLSVFSSILVNRAEGSEDVSESGRNLLIVPLIRVIEDGVADGTFRSTDPTVDADLVAAVVFHAAAFVLPHLGRRPTPTARDEALDFCVRALAIAD